MRVTEYGLEWELDPDEKKGQLGLLREDHYRPLFAPGQREESFQSHDIWLDLGANIGAFALRAARLVDTVVALEPEPINFAQLQWNIELNHIDNIVAREVAAVGGGQTSVPLAISNSFSSTHRVGHIRGRKEVEVDAVNINYVVDSAEANKIKMDIEGGEAEILEALNYDPIEEIVFEYHFSFLKDTHWSRFFKIIDRLLEAEFTILKQPREKTKTWHTIVWAKKL